MLVQCKFSGCTYQIQYPRKYCEKHKTVMLLCAYCGKIFPRTRVLYNSLIKRAKKRGVDSVISCGISGADSIIFCSKSCGAQRKKPGRIRGDHGPYNIDNEPIERLDLIFDKREHTHGSKRTRNWMSWGRCGQPLEDSLNPVADPYYSCSSLLAGTLIMSKESLDILKARVNDPDFQQMARWKWAIRIIE